MVTGSTGSTRRDLSHEDGVHHVNLIPVRAWVYTIPIGIMLVGCADEPSAVEAGSADTQTADVSDSPTTPASAPSQSSSTSRPGAEVANEICARGLYGEASWRTGVRSIDDLVAVSELVVELEITNSEVVTGETRN